MICAYKHYKLYLCVNIVAACFEILFVGVFAAFAEVYIKRFVYSAARLRHGLKTKTWNTLQFNATECRCCVSVQSRNSDAHHNKNYNI